MRPAHRNNRLNFLLLKLWLPPSFPTSKCFLLKKSHGSLLLKIKDNHIKIKVQAGASTERTLKSRLEFLLSWAPPRTPSGRLQNACLYQTCITCTSWFTNYFDSEKLEVAFSWDEMEEVQHIHGYNIFSPEYSLEGLMLKLKLQLLWPPDAKSQLTGKDPDAGEDWRQEKGAFWDAWMASLTWWTWVWVGSRSWWLIGKPGVLQSMGSQRVGHNWVTELNWYIYIHTHTHSNLCVTTPRPITTSSTKKKQSLLCKVKCIRLRRRGINYLSFLQAILLALPAASNSLFHLLLVPDCVLAIRLTLQLPQSFFPFSEASISRFLSFLTPLPNHMLAWWLEVVFLMLN